MKKYTRTKKYVYTAFALATLATLATGVPAMADDNGSSNTQSTLSAGVQGHVGIGMGRGMGMPGREGMRPAVVGTVSAISGDTITVSGRTGFGPNATTTTTTYTVNATNATVTKNGATSSVSNIVVGDTIAVQGTVSGTNVVATSIRDGMMGGPGMMKPAVFGKVTAVSGNTVTVSGKSGFGTNATTVTYMVDATNATVMKNGAASSVSNIAVGDTIVAEGTLTGTNLVATTIRDGVMPGGFGEGGQHGQVPMITGNGQPIVAGSITAINGNTITITNKSNVTYTIDATNAKIAKGPNTATISSLTVGDMIIAQGTINGNAVVATSVIDQSKPANTNNGEGDEGNSGQSHQGGGFFGGIGSFFAHIFGF